MLKTMVVKITKKTYPIAVACLAGGFAAYPKKKVMGHYLVINELTPRRINKERSPSLILGNAWFDKKYLKKNFTFVTKERKNKFVEVHRL